MRLLNILRSLFHGQRADHDLDAEVRAHLDLLADERIRAGLPPEAARRAARIELGGLEQVKEEVRAARSTAWLEQLWQDVRFGARQLRRNPGFTALIVLTLSLGIGASTVVFSLFYNLLFNPFAAKDASRLVVPVMQDGSRVYCRLSDLGFIREQNQVFENVVGYSNGFALLRDGPQTFQLYASSVTADAFQFYGVSPLLGRAIQPDDGKAGSPPVFVISYKTWKGIFNADPKILSRNFTVDGKPRTLVGVMPERFQAFGVLAQLWIPLTSTSGAPRSDEESDIALLTRLRSGGPMDAASAALKVIFARLARLHPTDSPKQFVVSGMRANDFFLAGAGAVYQSGIRLDHTLYLLLAAVMTLLLIACCNAGNLLFARATVRGREMAVRSALGATRFRIGRLLLAEGFILGAASCFVGCLFAWLGMKTVDAVLHQKAWDTVAGEVKIELNLPVLLFALAVALLTALVSGLAPALHILSRDLQPALVGTGQSVNGSLRQGLLRTGLVIGELALCIVLLIGTGLMIRSFLLLKHIDLGFNPRNVLVVYFAPPGNHGPNMAAATSSQEELKRREVVERLKALPGVAEVTAQDALPGYNGGWPSQFVASGEGRIVAGSLDGSDENLLRTLGLHMVRGNWLTQEEVNQARLVAAINQRLARDLFGDQNPIGQKIEIKVSKNPIRPAMDSSFEIVGVVADVKNFGPQQPAMPMAFIPNTIRGSFVLLLKTSVEPRSLVRAVEDQVWAVVPNELVGLCDPLEDFLQQHTYSTPELSVTIATPLASVGLLLVIIGTFSVMAYTVSLRTQEIGIRMALGGQKGSILRMILGRGAQIIAWGTIIGLSSSYALTRFLTSQIWGVSVTDPWTFAVVATLTALSGLAACYISALRAARVDPIIALRYE